MSCFSAYCSTKHYRQYRFCPSDCILPKQNEGVNKLFFIIVATIMTLNGGEWRTWMKDAAIRTIVTYSQSFYFVAFHWLCFPSFFLITLKKRENIVAIIITFKLVLQLQRFLFHIRNTQAGRTELSFVIISKFLKRSVSSWNELELYQWNPPNGAHGIFKLKVLKRQDVIRKGISTDILSGLYNIWQAFRLFSN